MVAAEQASGPAGPLLRCGRREEDPRGSPARSGRAVPEAAHCRCRRDVFGREASLRQLGRNARAAARVARPFESEADDGSASSHGRRCPSRILDGWDDVIVGFPAAQVAVHPIADLLWRASMILVRWTGDAGNDMPGRAVAARGRPVALDEAAANGLEVASLEASLRWS